MLKVQSVQENAHKNVVKETKPKPADLPYPTPTSEGTLIINYHQG